MRREIAMVYWMMLAGAVLAYTPEELLKAAPAECSDAAYLKFVETGDRQEWGKPYGQRTSVLEGLVNAQAAEPADSKRFIPKIAEFLDAICEMKTWTLNAHDYSLCSFKGTQPIVELGSARLGLTVAKAVVQFGDKLPEATVRRSRAELERRIIAPYLKTAAEAAADKKRTKFSIGEHWWFRTQNNWNAVCHSLVVRTAIVYFPVGSQERKTIIDSAVEAAPYFISGFTDDGYCSEGAGYWNYGYGHFLEMARALRAAPEKIDLFADPKTRTIAEYGFKYKMTPSLSPLFADGGGYPDEKFLVMCREIWPGIDSGKLPPSSSFDIAQIFISRDIAGGLTIGLKGGHNGEFHNHNDVGSYDIAVGDVIVTGDVGGEVYTRRTFSKDRYVSKVLNSYGHPVPRVAGKLQETGGKFAAKVLRKEFTDGGDALLLDISGAYRCPELQVLTREFATDRRGTIKITDHVKFSKPSAFSDPLMTLGHFEIDKRDEDGKGWSGRIVRDGVTLAFSVRAAVKDGKVDGWSEEKIKNPGKKPPMALTIDLEQVTEATLEFEFSAAK